jgi:hypothetical protein
MRFMEKRKREEELRKLHQEVRRLERALDERLERIRVLTQEVPMDALDDSEPSLASA